MTVPLIDVLLTDSGQARAHDFSSSVSAFHVF